MKVDKSIEVVDPSTVKEDCRAARLPVAVLATALEADAAAPVEVYRP